MSNSRLPDSSMRRRLLTASLSTLLMGAKTGHARQELAPATALPADSLYQLTLTIQDQSGQSHTLASLRGQPWIMTMFYTSCPYTCPMTIETIKLIDAQLPPAQRERLKFLLVTLDPERDTVDVLAKTAQQRNADAPRWLLARSAADDVRRLAAALGIQYRPLPDKEFNHSTILSLLDAQGRVRARDSHFGAVDRAFVATARAVLDESSS
jgi:protein SCO1